MKTKIPSKKVNAERLKEIEKYICILLMMHIYLFNEQNNLFEFSGCEQRMINCATLSINLKAGDSLLLDQLDGTTESLDTDHNKTKCVHYIVFFY